MTFIPILASIFTALNAASLKWYFNRTPLDTKTILAVSAIFYFLFSALFVPWYGALDQRFFEPRILLLFIIVVALGATQNYFTLKGMRTNTLHEYELIDILTPIFTILLAAAAFADERDPLRLSLALLASFAFLITHLRSSHFHFKRADRWLMYAVFVMAIEWVLVKPIVSIGSPVTLYTIRNGLLAVILLALFRPRLDKIRAPDWVAIIGITAVGSASGMLMWISIGNVGIVLTELVMLLTPLLTAAISVVLFKEHWNLRQAIGFTIVLACVALIQFLPN